MTARLTGRQAGIAAAASFVYGLLWIALTWRREGAASIGLGAAIWLATFLLGILGFMIRNNRRGPVLPAGEPTARTPRVLFIGVGLVLAFAAFAGLSLLQH
jgi:hypothetical protein